MNENYNHYPTFTGHVSPYASGGSLSTGNVTLGNYIQAQQSQQARQAQQQQESMALAILQQCQHKERIMLSGNKPVVVCGGEIKEAKNMDDAQSIAESLAHSKSADAYILKPVKKVAPKRDVVTTDL